MVILLNKGSLKPNCSANAGVSNYHCILYADSSIPLSDRDKTETVVTKGVHDDPYRHDGNQLCVGKSYEGFILGRGEPLASQSRLGE